MDFFTSLTGDDDNDGVSLESAFATIQRGVEALSPGDTLKIGAGTYVEHVRIRGKGSTDPDHPSEAIHLRPHHEDDVVVIDGAINAFEERTHEVFREPGNDDWLQKGKTDLWVSRDPLEQGIARGAFLPLPEKTGITARHVRLITHGHPKDLRADNQRFGSMPAELAPGDPPGPVAKDPRHPDLPRRPWAYLGPGIWQDTDGHIRIRLTHTTHTSRGVANYRGTTDPRELPLAICTDQRPTLWIVNSGGVQVHGITVRGGGGYAVSVEGTADTVLDHLTVLAGSQGVNIHGHARSTTIEHCVVDGGLPGWMFRSDIKNEYTIKATNTKNPLGKHTSNALLRSAPNTDGFEIAFCELVNGHDVVLGGTEVDFHHCYVADINDDFPYVGTTAVNLRVHHNVVERVLTFLSLEEDSASGPVRVYRNLVDLRQPTRGRRPHPRPDVVEEVVPVDPDNDELDELDELELSVPRFGMILKASKKETDPPLDFFQNTVLVANQARVAAYPHFFAYNNLTPRRFYNNVFVAFLSTSDHDKPIVVLPLPNASSVTDGNAYLRIGTATEAAFFHQRFGSEETFGNYDTLQQMRESDYWTATQAFHPPGYEARGIDVAPGFRQLAPWPIPAAVAPLEDLRLRDDAPASQHGAILPPELQMLDPPTTGVPDIGCYRVDAPPLKVGVNAGRRFPPGPPVVAPVNG
jgi:hypothetical protein